MTTMPPVKTSLLRNLQFFGFSTLVCQTVVIFSVICSCGGQSVLIGSSQPMVATVGDDVILPCYLNPAMNVFDMTVEWTRPVVERRFVLVWRDGVELQKKKHVSYEGRTSLFTEELKNGNISLKLSKVKPADEGRYRCFVPQLSKETTVKLVVGAVSSPVVTIAEKNTSISGVLLQCGSKGWYPEPEVLWLDSEGNLLSAGPRETVRGPDDLYTVSSTVTVEKTDSNSFTCRVQQRDINQTRETHIHVADFLFQDQSKSSSSSGSSVPIIIGLIVVVIFILTALLLAWKLRKNKRETKRKSPEDGPEHREEVTGDNIREESVPLMTQVNNVDSREKNTNVHVTEIETHQDPLVTEPEVLRDTDGTERERNHTSVNTEKETLISTQETQQGDNMMRRQEEKGCDNGEGEDSGQRQSHVSPSEENKKNHEDEETQKVTEDKYRSNDSEHEASETEDQCLMEEEQLTTERKTISAGDTEKLQKQLKSKERDEKKFEEQVSKLIGQKKDKEKQIKELRKQLEEVDKQREETERKLQLVNRKQETMETETQREETETDQSEKDFYDAKNDLERKKEELQKQLNRMETWMETIKKNLIVVTEKKVKVTNEKEEILKHLRS